MSGQPPVRPDGVQFNKRVAIALVIVLLVIITPLLGYYVTSYYSATRLTVDIVSGARMLGDLTNYTLLIRISVPGSIMPVSFWTPFVTLSLDSFDLGGTIPCKIPNSPDVLQLNPSDQLTCRGYWYSSFAGGPSVEAALNQTNTDYLVLSVGFHQVETGWYNQSVIKTISMNWTWS